MKHDDSDEVMVRYEASSNITFHGERSIGITWGDWRGMSETDKNEALTDWLFDLVSVGVMDEEEDSE